MVSTWPNSSLRVLHYGASLTKTCRGAGADSIRTLYSTTSVRLEAVEHGPDLEDCRRLSGHTRREIFSGDLLSLAGAVREGLADRPWKGITYNYFGWDPRIDTAEQTPRSLGLRRPSPPQSLTIHNYLKSR